MNNISMSIARRKSSTERGIFFTSSLINMSSEQIYFADAKMWLL